MQSIIAFEICYWEDEYRKWKKYNETLVAISHDMTACMDQLVQIMLECCDRMDESHRKCELFRIEYYNLTGQEYKHK
jgi:hypothetical protein